jgi:hypothetical protein
MRIIIETQNEGRILLEPEKLSETESQQQATQGAAIDGGAPSEVLMNAIASTDISSESEEMQGEEISNIEDTSSFH